MNAWRCAGCHHLFTDSPLQRDGNLRTCPICGGMVCDVTHTKLGQEFLAQQASVPATEESFLLNKKISFMDDAEVQS